MRTINPDNALIAQRFARQIPRHLRDDALLASVVENLLRGMDYRPASWRFIYSYMNKTTKPMTKETFARTLGLPS